MSTNNYSIGLDYGTNSVRALMVNVANGKEIAQAVWNYSHGEKGVILSRDPNLARQHPQAEINHQWFFRTFGSNERHQANDQRVQRADAKVVQHA